MKKRLETDRKTGISNVYNDKGELISTIIPHLAGWMLVFESGIGGDFLFSNFDDAVWNSDNQ